MADRLYRSPTDRVIAGVAGGMATWLNLDPSLVRVAWVLLAILSGGIFVLVYFVMMIVVPLPPPGWRPAPRMPGSPPWTPPGQGWSGASQGWSAGATGGQAPGPGAGASVPSGTEAQGAVPGWDAGQPGAWGAPGTTPGQSWTPPRVDSGNAGIVFGAVLVLLGAWFLVDRYVSVDWDLVWPIVVIGLGVALMAGALWRSRAGR